MPEVLPLKRCLSHYWEKGIQEIRTLHLKRHAVSVWILSYSFQLITTSATEPTKRGCSPKQSRQNYVNLSKPKSDALNYT